MRNVVLFLFILLVVSVSAQEEPQLNFYPFPLGNQWGFVSDSGEFVENVFYSKIVTENANPSLSYIAINNSGKYGVVTGWGEIDTLVPFEHDSAFYVSSGILFRKKNDYNFLNTGFEGDYGKITPIGSLDSVLIADKLTYLYGNGNSGIINSGKLVSAPYPYILSFQSELYNPWEVNSDYWLISNGEKFGLRSDTKELIPCIAESIQLFDFGFARYWVGYWVYVRLSDGFTVDPKGTQVRIYSHNLWKIYDSDMKTSRLYRGSENLFGGRFEDYFFLDNDAIAVKKGDKIGAIDFSGKVIIDCKYDQILALSDSYFKCLENGKWLLVDYNGRVKTETGYDQILKLESRDDSYFEIRNSNYAGLLRADGVEILPCEFNEVIISDSLVLTLNKTSGIEPYSILGKPLFNKVYSYYFELNGLTLLYLNKSEFDVFSKAGKMNSRVLFDIYIFNDIFKGYSGEGLEIVSFNRKTGAVEEQQLFQGDISFEIDDLESRLFRYSMVRNGTKSVLEENQLTAKYGFRGLWTSDLLIEPIYIEARNSDFDYQFCVSEYKQGEFQLLNDIALRTSYTYDIVDPTSASVIHSSVPSSTFKGVHSGLSFSINRLVFGTNGQAFLDADKTRVTKLIEADYHSFFFVTNQGGTYERTLENEGSIKAYDLFLKRNSNDNLFFGKELIPQLFNPALRYRLSGGVYSVKPEDSESKKQIVDALKNKSYQEFHYFGDGYEGSEFVARNNNTAFLWGNCTVDSLSNRSFYGIKPMGDLAYEVTSLPFQLGTIHALEPKFVYREDSLTRYVNARIIQKVDGGYQLKDVQDSVLIDEVFEEIQPLTKTSFKALKENTWKVYDRNGILLSELYFNRVAISDFGGYEATHNGNRVLFDNQFQNAIELYDFEQLKDSLFAKEEGERTFLWNPFTGLRDTVKSQEKLIPESNFIGWKTKGKIFVRQLGKSTPIPVAGTELPIGANGVLISKGATNLEIIGANGNLLVSRKKLFTEYKISTDLIWMMNEKNWLLLNQNGMELYNGKKGKTIFLRDYSAVIELQDEAYGVLSNGTNCTVDEAMNAGSIAEMEDVKFSVHRDKLSQQFGVMDVQGGWLIDPKYSGIRQYSDEEFEVQLPAAKGIMLDVKTEALPAEYDELTMLNFRTWLVRKGKRYGLYSDDLGWIMPLR